MAVNLSPIGNDAPFVDANGDPLSGGLLYTYTAGSSAAETTYTTSVGNVQNANPIELNSNGYPAVGASVVSIWLTAGVSYKFVLKTSGGTTVWTRDNIDGINDTAVTADQWVSGPAPTYVSATSFTLVGDQTSTFTVGRRVKTTNSGGTVYSRISASAYGALTTITVVNDSGTLDAGLSAVSYGLITPDNTSAPAFRDNTFRVADNSDPTKLVALELSGITTATTRTITVPDTDVTLLTGAATQAQQETGTSTTVAVTPGRQQFHASAAKGWIFADAAGGAAASYNVTSVTDSGPGDVLITWATDMSSANYSAIGIAKQDFGGAAATTYACTVQNTSFAAGTTAMYNARVSDGAAADPNHWSLAIYGDQA